MLSFFEKSGRNIFYYCDISPLVWWRQIDNISIRRQHGEK